MAKRTLQPMLLLVAMVCWWIAGGGPESVALAFNAIVWDRVFGTYREGSARATGLGPREPGLRESLTLPFTP